MKPSERIAQQRFSEEEEMRSIMSSSVISKHSNSLSKSASRFRMTSRGRGNTRTVSQEETFVPPVPLKIDQPSHNHEEDVLRERKNRQEKMKQLELQEQKEKERLEKLNRRNQGGAADMRAKEFTFDHNGNPLPMNKVNVGRLPSREAAIDFAIKNPEARKKKKRAVQAMPAGSSVAEEITPKTPGPPGFAASMDMFKFDGSQGAEPSLPPIDASLIFHRSRMNEKDFMKTNNSIAPGPAEVM